MNQLRMTFMVLCAALLWAGAAQASASYQINFKLAGATQTLLGNQTGPTVYESTVTKFKVTNKDLLFLLAIEYATPYPEGAQLALGSAGQFFVLSPDGLSTLQTIGAPVMALSSLTSVRSGVQDTSPTGSTKMTWQYSVFCDLNFGASNHLELHGLDTLKYTEKNATAHGKSAISIKFVGGGFWGGDEAVVSGTLSGVSVF